MNQEFSELNFLDDLDKVRLIPEISRWKIEKTGILEIKALMYPISVPDELFQARLLWKVYPDDPPSLKFTDPTSGRIDSPNAWPRVRGFRPSNLDACVNWTLEGFQIHPEWKSDQRFQWKPNGNVLLRILRTLQGELDYYFEGRHQ